MPTARQVEAHGPQGLYSYSLFHYDERMSEVLQHGIELGRSFIQPRYWGRRGLDYLWSGIGAYLARYPQYRYLFGPVSISGGFLLPHGIYWSPFIACGFRQTGRWLNPVAHGLPRFRTSLPSLRAKITPKI
jgi:putative hemolysin